MSPKKKTSSKKISARANARKDATREITRGKSAADGAKKPAPRKSPAVKPDEMETDVLEFIQAIDDYKRVQARPFPSWSEILDIVKELGYERQA